MRTFIAIALPTQIRTKIEQQQQFLERDLSDPPVRWVKSKSIHLTLKFLGDISSQQALQIQAIMPQVTSQYSSTHVIVHGLGCFPNFSQPRVIWIGLKDAQAVLVNLQKQLDDELRSLGFAPEERGFSPHLTIGRVHRQVNHHNRRELGKKLARVEVPELGRFTADTIHLFKSELKPSGAEYTCLASASLGAGHE